ncbi:hypothetical protein ACSBR1_015169 [Camellia fascicularis]
MEFKWSPFWIQVHGLPLEKLTKANGETIGMKIGRLIRVETHCEGLLLYHNYLRIRVELDVTKPLPKGHDRRVCKFVTRVEGSVSGYGLELWTGVARSTGLPVEHYRKQVDSMEARIRPVLNRWKD